jgi:hypothetical protein
MTTQKGLITRIGEWFDERNTNDSDRLNKWSKWMPTPGNIIFTLVIVALLIFTQQTWANNTPNSVNVPGPSATTVNYQGRLAAPDGTPKNGTFGMSFAIWNAANGGSIVWGPENHSAVTVIDGLFNVGLGSQTSGGIPTTVWNGDRYLEITVGGETLTPRELLRSVPIAGMALTVPDGGITSSKLNLSSGTVCRSSSIDMSFPGGDYVSQDIPELTLNFELTQPSKVLVWMDGLGKFAASTGEAGINLRLDEIAQVSSLFPQKDFWFGIKGQRILDIGSGTHTLKASAYSNTQGTMTVHGSGAHRVCINYLVLGQ